MGDGVDITMQRRLSPAQLHQLDALADAAADVDGVTPLNEQTALELQGGESGTQVAVARAHGELVGFGVLSRTGRGAGADGEIVVAPASRGRGVGTSLVLAMTSAVEPEPLRLWAHGHLASAQRLARSLGFDRVRDLWQMCLDLTDAELAPAPPLPTGVQVRTFEPGRDEEAWLAVNTRAFAEHPEQSGMTLVDLKARMAEPWFDPCGFFLAERGGVLVGFHWTKVHSATNDRPPIGEVYVVGVDPSARGLGLGRMLTTIGLRHLREQGLGAVMLYVDADNVAAIKTYSRLGFVHCGTDVMYCRAC